MKTLKLLITTLAISVSAVIMAQEKTATPVEPKAETPKEEAGKTVNVANQEVKFEIGGFVRAETRITSYNVCYTKLLRQLPKRRQRRPGRRGRRRGRRRLRQLPESRQPGSGRSGRRRRRQRV